MGEVFGNLPDWVSVLLAIAGLFGGTGAGVYYGGVRRARLDDRREFLKVWMPWISRGVFYSFPPGFDELPEPATLDEDFIYDLALANATADGLDAVTDLAELLPWQDRALWRGYAGCLLDYADPINIMVLRDKPLGGDERVKALNLAKNARWLIGDDPGQMATRDRLAFALTASGDELRTYLLRMVNPPFGASLRNIAFTAQLVVHGSWPFAKQLRLSNYRMLLWWSSSGPAPALEDLLDDLEGGAESDPAC